MLDGATPWFVLGTLVFVLLYRVIEQDLGKAGRRLPLCVRYFVWLYLLFSGMIGASLRSMWCDVLRVSVFLEPAATAASVRLMIRKDAAACLRHGTKPLEEEEEIAAWAEEASLQEYPNLRFFSLLSPLWLFLTFGTCSYHTILHTMTLHRYCRADTPGSRDSFALHDKTIRILALPMVYGLMSFEGVMRMWGVVINRNSASHQFLSFHHRKRFLEDMYEASFMVGDLYESYALLNFGLLIMRVVKKKMMSRVASAVNSEVHEAVGGQHEMSVSLRSSCHELETDHHEGGPISNEDLGSAVDEMIRELKGLTIFGIKLFCFTCTTQAVYRLACSTLGYYNVNDSWFNMDKTQGHGLGYFQREDVRNHAHYFFYGAGFLASFAAIGNVIEVERGFHKTLHEFSPFLKFWGTKVLVSIAFLQTIAMSVIPPFGGWSLTRQNLLYASLLTLECFIISVFHLFAWAPNERWYGHPRGDKSGDDSPDNDSDESESMSE